MPPDKPDLSVVSGSLDNPPPAEAADPVKSAGEGGKRNSRLRGYGEIFENSPVIAIGVQDKWFCYFDYHGQVRKIDNHTADVISGLYGGRVDLLESVHPRRNKEGHVTGFAQDRMRAAMQRACGEHGVVDLEQRVRETGCWTDEAGDLIWHCGDTVLTRGDRGGNNWAKPGLIGDHVYPAKPPAPRPAECSEDEGRAAARELLELLETWNWARGDLDAHLMLGWILSGLVGGALRWRPMGWVTGDAATGKSTLQELVHAVCGGDPGMVVASDASEAGIRQLLMQSTRPVWLDEAEAEVDDRKLQAVVKLARQAASGGQVLRGGAEHKGATFRVRSAMMFSSILIPSMKDQDLSRLAIFKLRRLDKERPQPKIDLMHWKGIGGRIRRRLWDAWPQWHETLEHYRIQLADAGHNSRGQDQFGTLLAMADLVLWGGEPNAEVSAEYVEQLDAELLHADTGQSHDWQRFINHLFSQPLDIHRQGVRYTLGQWIMVAANLDGKPAGLGEPLDANAHLMRYGIKVTKPGKRAEIEIANNHSGLAPLLKDTHWAGGVHTQAVERIEGWYRPKQNVRTWAGVPVRVSAFPLSSIDWGRSDDVRPQSGTEHEPMKI